MEESPNILYDKSIDIDDTLIYVLDDMIVNLGIVIELDLSTKDSAFLQISDFNSKFFFLSKSLSS